MDLTAVQRSDQAALDDVAKSETPLTRDDVARVADLFPMRKNDAAGIWLSERTRVRDQVGAATCVPAALTTVIEHAYGVPLSDGFIDYNLKRDRGDSSDGALLGELARSVSRHGICLRDLYVAGAPSPEAERDASLRIPAIVPLLEPGPAAAGRALELLHADYKIAFGCPVDRSFLDYRPGFSKPFAETRVFDAPVHIVSDHAMCLVGHRTADDAFLVQSSHGVGWGLAGYAWITRRYLTMWGSAGFCYVARADE